MNNKQEFLEIVDHFQDLMNKIGGIYYSDRFEPDEFGGYMEGFMGKLDQAEEMLVDADEWYGKKRRVG